MGFALVQGTSSARRTPNGSDILNTPGTLFIICKGIFVGSTACNRIFDELTSSTAGVDVHPGWQLKKVIYPRMKMRVGDRKPKNVERLIVPPDTSSPIVRTIKFRCNGHEVKLSKIRNVY